VLVIYPTIEIGVIWTFQTGLVGCIEILIGMQTFSTVSSFLITHFCSSLREVLTATAFVYFPDDVFDS
jgi:hypothetical protein